MTPYMPITSCMYSSLLAGEEFIAKTEDNKLYLSLRLLHS